METTYDAVIVGAGTSGSYVAMALSQAGMTCLLLEAGKSFDRHTYPTKEVDANAQLFWGGGIELNTAATIGFLRPKVVGGGSVVNQALMDRFDDLAFDAWRDTSGIGWLTRDTLDPWYDAAEKEIELRTVPTAFENRNAVVFREGFEANGYRWAPLKRGQSDCGFEQGSCCIECLSGCRRDSKQSTPVTALKKALAAGLTLRSEVHVEHVRKTPDGVEVWGVDADGTRETYRGRRLVLASGAIGNSTLLLRSGFGDRLPALGHHFFCHPQFMHLARYAEPVDAHRGPLQSYKSDDPGFRKKGFKLENVFAPPVGIAMLLPGIGVEHARYMRDIRHLACIEVAVRDTAPGRIRVSKRGTPVIEKRLDAEDRRRQAAGLEAVRNIFGATGALEVLEGTLGVALHLQGGCNMGTDPTRSVTGPDFRLHGHDDVWAADSSVFPNAPGINPAFTIMAMSLKAADEIVKDAR